MSRVIARYVPVNTASADESGVLLFVDGKLVACIVHLTDEAHAELFGNWHIEAMFSEEHRPNLLVHGTLDAAVGAITEKVTGQPLAISGPIEDLPLPRPRPRLSVVRNIEDTRREQRLSEDEADQIGLAEMVDQRGDCQQDRH